MNKMDFTRKYYLEMWEAILSSYQWWGHDLISLLDNINKTNPIVSEIFYKIYSKDYEQYIKRTQSSISMFYQKLDSLIPNQEKLYTKLTVTSLKERNKRLAIKESVFMRRYNYLIAILCFIEEFATRSIKDENVSSHENLLSAHAENIDIFVEKNKKVGVTIIRITIPCELVIEYSASNNPI